MFSTREDLAWAAGLFEGEGYFAAHYYRRNNLRLRVGISMTDKDVILRFQSVIGGRSKIYPYVSGVKHHKKQYRLSWDTFEGFQYVATIFWPWLGKRRRKRVKEALKMAQKYYSAPPIPGRGRRRGHDNLRRVA